METVTETLSRVRHVSLVGMNSSKLEISSGVAGPWFSSTISTETMTQQKETYQLWNKYHNILQMYCKGEVKCMIKHIITKITDCPLFYTSESNHEYVTCGALFEIKRWNGKGQRHLDLRTKDCFTEKGQL